MVAVSSVSLISFLMPYVIHGTRPIRLFAMTDIIEAITGVFDAVGQWLQSALAAMIPIFWDSSAGTGGQLTFLGVLAVVGLAFSVVFLVIGIIQRFLKFGA